MTYTYKVAKTEQQSRIKRRNHSPIHWCKMVAVSLALFIFHSCICPSSRAVPGIEQVDVVNLLGNFCFDAQVCSVLKLCSQRIYLLKLLRNQGLSREQLHTVFIALVVSRLRYALPAWSGFLKTDETGQILSLIHI